MSSVPTGREPPALIIAPPGPRSRAIAARLVAVESPAFEARRATREALSDSDQAPIAYERGRGSNLWDSDGNRYVDLIAGFGAVALGHADPSVRAAVDAQSDRLSLALGDVYSTEVKATLCERLAAMFPERGARVMLGLSGADAVTAALKSAVLATGKPGVIAFHGSYHGLSYAPLAACGLAPSFREPFGAQLGDHVRFAPYPSGDAGLAESVAAVGRALDSATIGAVLVEPILGRGGCVVPPASFLPALRELCDRHGALLIADEIWTGMARSGSWLASAGVVPDIVCVGKALGGGLPVSACVGRDSVMQAWGAHGGGAIHTATHFGWPLGCAAALATLDAIERDGLVERARVVGERWRLGLRGAGFRVTGAGLMVGVHLRDAAQALAVSRALLSRGWLVLTGGARGDALTLTPALNVDEALLDGFVVALKAATLGA